MEKESRVGLQKQGQEFAKDSATATKSTMALEMTTAPAAAAAAAETLLCYCFDVAVVAIFLFPFSFFTVVLCPVVVLSPSSSLSSFFLRFSLPAMGNKSGGGFFSVALENLQLATCHTFLGH